MKSIDIAMVLEPYTDSIKELIELNDGDESMAINTMAHDYIGLSANDEYFLQFVMVGYSFLSSVISMYVPGSNCCIPDPNP